MLFSGALKGGGIVEQIPGPGNLPTGAVCVLNMLLEGDGGAILIADAARAGIGGTGGRDGSGGGGSLFLQLRSMLLNDLRFADADGQTIPRSNLRSAVIESFGSCVALLGGMLRLR